MLSSSMLVIICLSIGLMTSGEVNVSEVITALMSSGRETDVSKNLNYKLCSVTVLETTLFCESHFKKVYDQKTEHIDIFISRQSCYKIHQGEFEYDNRLFKINPEKHEERFVYYAEGHLTEHGTCYPERVPKGPFEPVKVIVVDVSVYHKIGVATMRNNVGMTLENNKHCALSKNSCILNGNTFYYFEQ